MRHWCAPRVQARWRRWAGMGFACCRCRGQSGRPSRRLWAVRAPGSAAGCPCSLASALPAPTWAASTCGRASCPGTSLLTLMGFRLEGIFPAALLPLLLTMILFLGPLMQLSMDCSCDLADGLKVVLAPRSWARCLTDMRWLRNQVIAPLTEELVFRACMLPMLAPCTGLGPAVFTCPLFFGVAHFHHIFEQLRFRQSSVGSIFLSAAFQFSYTAVFGAYTAFLFIRTGHLIGPVLCHSFCNYMGFPAVCAALEHPQRRPLLAGYALGGPFALCLPQKVCQPHITQEETNLRWKRNRLGHLGVEAFLALSTSDRCHDATSLVPGGTQPKGSEHEQPCHATLELKVLSQTQGGCPASPSLRVVVGEKETDVQSLPAAPKHNWP
ncbi:CAAX prenyl protease 2 isoform X4 [Sus scrofa]|uniref:CAAX prenyl protease 2 isoform X4 n=1 Tax=Sus scrofa TaxID=9823 RepID=UPI0003AE9A35|nr:CAAX prenyl protease 2 isoform X4 [Sus scrofa]